MKKNLFRLLIFLFLWPSLSFGQEYQRSLFEKTDHITIPFEFINGFVVLDIRYGSLPLKFIFDTGAEYSVLTYKEYAILNHARFGKQVTILGADLTSHIDATIIHDNTIELANRLVIAHLDMILLNEDILNIGKYVGFPIHGILGANAFSRFAMEINYKKKLLIFHNPQSPVKKNFIEIPVTFKARKPYIQMDVQMPNGENFTGKYLVDCGADLSLLLVLGSHPLLSTPQNTLVTNIASGLGGKLKGYMGRVKKINLGSTQIPSPLIHYQEIPDSTHLRKFNSNGIVGNKILSFFTVYIDYPRHKLYLKPNKRRSQTIPVDKSGLSIIASGPFLNHITVAQVLPGTPADQAGILPGDIIHRIGIFAPRFIGIERVTKKLARKDGKKIKMTLLRDGKKIKVQFVLKTYI